MADVKALNKALLMEMLRRMLLIRRFEERSCGWQNEVRLSGRRIPTSVRKPSRWGPASPCAMMTI